MPGLADFLTPQPKFGFGVPAPFVPLPPAAAPAAASPAVQATAQPLMAAPPAPVWPAGLNYVDSATINSQQMHNMNANTQAARAGLWATMQPGDQMVATGPNSFGFSRAPQTVRQVAAPSAPAPHPGPLGPAASASFPARTQESPDLIMGGHYVSGGGMTNHDLALLSGLLQPRVSPVDTATASVIGIGHKQYEDAVRGGQDPSVAMIPFLKLLHDISTGGGMGYFGDRLNQNQAPAPAAPVK